VNPPVLEPTTRSAAEKGVATRDRRRGLHPLPGGPFTWGRLVSICRRGVNPTNRTLDRHIATQSGLPSCTSSHRLLEIGIFPTDIDSAIGPAVWRIRIRPTV